jgi:hypothetical protein
VGEVSGNEVRRSGGDGGEQYRHVFAWELHGF